MITFTQISGVFHSHGADAPVKPFEIELPFDERKKSRLKTQSRCGQEMGFILPRGHILRSGTLIKSEAGDVAVILAAPEKVTTASTADPTLLCKASYHLGNRHVALQVGDGWVRYQHDHVLDDMVKGLGLKVQVELAAFEPEDGAYSHGGHHHHH
ncbi:MAG: urease accessory protein UreE [Pseudomonadales bacterium]|nr:urease accessory protein UreE [Pseudomonadales bacterium]